MIVEEKGLKSDTILLENPEFLRIIPPFGTDLFKKIPIYDFDPKLPKRIRTNDGKK